MNDFKSTVLILLLFFACGGVAVAAKDCPDCPEMVLIPAGSFVMGTDSRSDEKPQHVVTVNSFLMGKTEVTQRLWLAVMFNNSGNMTTGTFPQEDVSWDDIQQFISKINQKTGQKYRLPSEAEWEYAARAGTTTKWSFGNDKSQLGDHAWYGENSGSRTHEVGQKSPNPFGLFDMHGNVWEWVEDCWHENYVGAPADGSAWTVGCIRNQRVLRSGSSLNLLEHVTSTYRSHNFPQNRNTIAVGFRLAKDLTNDDVQRFSKAAKGQSGALKGGPSAIEEAKQKCDELGFETGTEAYGKCVLKLSK